MTFCKCICKLVMAFRVYFSHRDTVMYKSAAVRGKDIPGSENFVCKSPREIKKKKYS